jgi:hypothetical protein
MAGVTFGAVWILTKLETSNYRVYGERRGYFGGVADRVISANGV